MELTSHLLALGVDDFAHLVSQSSEMRARLQAALQRTQDRSDRQLTETERLEVGRLRLDVRRHEVWLDGRRLTLTPIEFDLLRYLMCRAGEVVRRPETLDAVWGIDFNPGSNVIDRHIRTLRMKLGESRLIETIPHIGYRLRCDQEPSSLGNAVVRAR
jgi:DNA-binding response OmpR family regulator